MFFNTSLPVDCCRFGAAGVDDLLVLLAAGLGVLVDLIA